MKGRVNPIYQLAIKSVELSRIYSNRMTLQAQCKQNNIIEDLQKLKIDSFRVGKISQKKGIGIRNILIQGSLRLSLYHLPQGETMKLHDHPSMSVINYIVKGKMQGRIYTHHSQKLYKKKVLQLKQGDLKFIDGIISHDDNLHEFLAVQPTFFLDIIFPDYDHDKICTFYEQESIEDGLAQLKKVEGEEIDFFQF